MATDLTSLEDLLARVARADRIAFAELYQRTSAKLMGVALGILKDRTSAEDVLQAAYVRVWKYADAYDPTAARPITWLSTIVRNAAIDEVRRSGAGRAVLWREDEGDPLDLVMDPTVAPAPWDLEALRSCLRGLDPVHRQCILLAYYEGYSREDLSERFDRPIGTIKTWLHRGLNALKQCLGGA
jgi:RNA polymerase sigma-70 factor (ECF subfamily)